VNHVSDADIEHFSRRTLPGQALIPFADHVAECEECRQRVNAHRLSDARAGGVVDEVLGVGAHVPEDDLHAYVGGHLSLEQRTAIDEHLDNCAACAEEVRDLQEFAATFRVAAPQRPRWVAPLAAAAVLLLAVAGVAGWRYTRSRAAAGPNDSSPAPLQTEAVKEPTAPGAAPAGSSPQAVVSLLLTISARRNADPATVPTVTVTSETKELRLEVMLGDADYRSYRVDVKTVGGGTVPLNRVIARRTVSGQSLVVPVLADTLAPGDYVLSVRGASPGGDTDDLGRSLFRVERR
jgi:hypothetical protein